MTDETPERSGADPSVLDVERHPVFDTWQNFDANDPAVFRDWLTYMRKWCDAVRVLASVLGFSSVEALLSGKTGVMAGLKNNNVHYTAFADAISKSKSLNKDLLRMAHILAQ